MIHIKKGKEGVELTHGVQFVNSWSRLRSDPQR